MERLLHGQLNFYQMKSGLRSTVDDDHIGTGHFDHSKRLITIISSTASLGINVIFLKKTNLDRSIANLRAEKLNPLLLPRKKQ